MKTEYEVRVLEVNKKYMITGAKGHAFHVNMGRMIFCAVR